MEGQIVVEYADIRFVFTGTRNEVSGKFKERVALYKHEILLNVTHLEDFSEFGIFGYNSVLDLIKAYHHHILKLGVALPYYYNHHFGVMMGRFKRSKVWRAGIEAQLVKYQEALHFPYEFNRRIKVKRDGVYLELYETNKRKDSVKVLFRKEDNRRYSLFITIIFETSVQSTKSYSYDRNMGVEDFDILVKQVNEWMSRAFNAVGQATLFKNLHNGTLDVLKEMKDDVNVVIDRLNKGWEI